MLMVSPGIKHNTKKQHETTIGHVDQQNQVHAVSLLQSKLAIGHALHIVPHTPSNVC